MVAIIGGEPHRFRPLIHRYRQAGLRAGHSPDQLKVGIHSLGYVAESAAKAADDFFPGYAQSFSEIGKERGWGPVTGYPGTLQRPARTHGALLVGDPVLRVNESLGGISRLTFQMSGAALPHAKLMRAIELVGTRVAPLVRLALASGTAEALLPGYANLWKDVSPVSGDAIRARLWLRALNAWKPALSIGPCIANRPPARRIGVRANLPPHWASAT